MHRATVRWRVTAKEKTKQTHNSRKERKKLDQRLSGTITMWTEDLERIKMAKITFMFKDYDDDDDDRR